MEWKQFPSLHSGQGEAPGPTVSYRVEQHLHFAHGYVEVRRYFWSQPVVELPFVTDDLLALNMALSSRPAKTRLTRIGGACPAVAPAGTGAGTGAGGRLMMMMPSTRYRLSAPSGALRSIHFAADRRKFEALLGDLIDWNDWSRIGELNCAGGEIEGLLGRIYDELRHSQIGREAAIEAYANALCIELARRFRQGQPARPDLHRGGLASWRMNLLRERVAADAPAPRIAELAELCGLTERQLGRAFKAETGQTIGRYVDEATMARATRLLTTTDLPIAAIAARLGFASVDTFAHSFRRLTGRLPSQLRQG